MGLIGLNEATFYCISCHERLLRLLRFRERLSDDLPAAACYLLVLCRVEREPEFTYIDRFNKVNTLDHNFDPLSLTTNFSNPRRTLGSMPSLVGRIVSRAQNTCV